MYIYINMHLHIHIKRHAASGGGVVQRTTAADMYIQLIPEKMRPKGVIGIQIGILNPHHRS